MELCTKSEHVTILFVLAMCHWYDGDEELANLLTQVAAQVVNSASFGDA